MKSNRNRCFLIPNWWGGGTRLIRRNKMFQTSAASWYDLGDLRCRQHSENLGVHGSGLVSYQLTTCHPLKCHSKAVNKKDTIASFAKVAPILVYTPIYNRFSQNEISLQLAYK